MSTPLFCREADHCKNEITSLCTRKNCHYNRFACNMCLAGSHRAHQHDMILINDVINGNYDYRIWPKLDYLHQHSTNTFPLPSPNTANAEKTPATDPYEELIEEWFNELRYRLLMSLEKARMQLLAKVKHSENHLRDVIKDVLQEYHIQKLEKLVSKYVTARECVDIPRMNDKLNDIFHKNVQIAQLDKIFTDQTFLNNTKALLDGQTMQKVLRHVDEELFKPFTKISNHYSDLVWASRSLVVQPSLYHNCISSEQLMFPSAIRVKIDHNCPKHCDFRLGITDTYRKDGGNHEGSFFAYIFPFNFGKSYLKDHGKIVSLPGDCRLNTEHNDLMCIVDEDYHISILSGDRTIWETVLPDAGAYYLTAYSNCYHTKFSLLSH